MPFSEVAKTQVRRMAAFRCCRCEAIGVEIHHIIPQSEGGSDSIDNAAPLCAKCHSDFGDNPLKRKEIREMRDWWYGVAAVRYSSAPQSLQHLEDKLDKLLQSQSTTEAELGDIKRLLSSYLGEMVDLAGVSGIRQIANQIVNMEKPPFQGGSPCEMSGQICPSAICDGIMDVSGFGDGVVCGKCGQFIPAG